MIQKRSLREMFVCGVMLVLAGAAAGAPILGTPRLMQGPMIGAVTGESIPVWMRASGPYPCQIVFDTSPDFDHPQKTAEVEAEKARDYIVVLSMEGLTPGTRYYYRVEVAGRPDPYLTPFYPFSCKTAPAATEPGVFTVGFGSCPRFARFREQPLWRAVQQRGTDLFFWLGDNMYGDSLDRDILFEEYLRQRDVAELQPVLHSIPQLAIWDDHDYGLNDSDRTNPAKEDALAVFKQVWANPSYGLPETPGVFFTYSYGGVDFFFVDDRYYRDPNKEQDSPEKTFLGAAQFAWLEENLKRSTTPFKVLVCGSGWTAAKGPGGDSWASCLHERDRLFDFIRDEKISGVVLLSGDTHVGELNAIPYSEKGGYDLYDVDSSPLAQDAGGNDWVERTPELRIRPVYGKGSNFGFLQFDMRERPRLRVQLISEENRSVWAPLDIYADELVNGVCSWKKKIDPQDMKRYKRAQEGKPYYR